MAEVGWICMAAISVNDVSDNNGIGAYCESLYVKHIAGVGNGNGDRASAINGVSYHKGCGTCIHSM